MELSNLFYFLKINVNQSEKNEKYGKILIEKDKNNTRVINKIRYSIRNEDYMELRTVMLMLGLGSLLFGALLAIFRFKMSESREVPYWIIAKIFQGVGSLLLYFRTTTYDEVTVLANIFFL